MFDSADPVMAEMVADLRAEQAVLDALVAGIADDDWSRPTPAPGWAIREQIAHLGGVDEFCLDVVVGDVSIMEKIAALKEAGGDARRAMMGDGAARPPAELLAQWRVAREVLNDAFLTVARDKPVHWAAGPMKARSFATSRVMECWAHGLDCFAALGMEPVDTDRIRHVCHLGYQALPHGFRVAGAEMPAPLTELRLELDGPSGSRWVFGRGSAPQTITGSAGEWARVAVQRMPASATTTLVAHGPLAEQALQYARAFA